MNARQSKISGIKRPTYHPMVRVGGFAAIIVSLWVIFSGVDLMTSVLLVIAIGVVVVLFVFNRSPTR